MKTPLYDAINNYNANLRLHMPGHSGENLNCELYSNARFDVTELDFSDNLLNATGVILESEQLTAKAYNSKYCLYFTCGSTSALFTAIRVANVKKFYCLDNPHKSIINALELFGIAFEIVNTLPSDAQGIILTTPDYYGNCLDVKQIRLAHPNAFIIVDEAHGAHFAYSSLLPENVGGEADFVINGCHKTLPVFTGGAILRTDNTELYQRAVEYRAKLHSTSPSYLIMCSLDYARGYLIENGEQLYRELRQRIKKLRLPCGFRILPNDDFSRLVIEVPQNTTGYAVSNDAQEKGIYFELVEERRLVAIVTPFNMDKLDLLEGLNTSPKEIKSRDLTVFIGSEAKKDIGLYPPGKVYIKKGEIITSEMIELLQKDAERVFGLE